MTIWLGWILIAAEIAALVGYRYARGKWPLKFDL
jgi:hypothetical protein